MSDPKNVQNDPHQIDVPDTWTPVTAEQPLPPLNGPHIGNLQDWLERGQRPGETEVVFKEGDVAKVWLIGYPNDAMRLIGLQSRAYAQVYTPDISAEEITRYNAEAHKTRLQTPLDGVWFNFLLQNVTRAFTHQIVRYRIGTSFVQESMRYYRHGAVFVRVPHALSSPAIRQDPSLEDERLKYEVAVRNSVYTYFELLDHPRLKREDARGVMPHDMLTNIFFNASLRTLAHIYGQRTCCQAQHEEWTPVLAQIKQLLTQVHPEIGAWLKTPWEQGRWRCGFDAEYDQACRFADKFPAGRIATS